MATMEMNARTTTVSVRDPMVKLVDVTRAGALFRTRLARRVRHRMAIYRLIC